MGEVLDHRQPPLGRQRFLRPIGNLAADVDMLKHMIRMNQRAHPIADPLITRQIIGNAAIGGVGYVRMLSAVAPVLDAMVRAKACPRAQYLLQSTGSGHAPCACAR